MHLPRERGTHPRTPILARWEMGAKSLGQKEETKQKMKLSKRNLVKKKKKRRGALDVTSGILKVGC